MVDDYRAKVPRKIIRSGDGLVAEICKSHEDAKKRANYLNERVRKKRQHPLIRAHIPEEYDDE
jgi:hypothetical protein